MLTLAYSVNGPTRILITQSIVVVACTAFASVFGITHMYSAILGGVACIVPNAYAIWRAFDSGRNSTDSGVVGLMLRAEVAKFVLTGLLFALIFAAIPEVEPVTLLVVFTVAMFAGWIEAGLRLN